MTFKRICLVLTVLMVLALSACAQLGQSEFNTLPSSAPRASQTGKLKDVKDKAKDNIQDETQAHITAQTKSEIQDQKQDDINTPTAELVPLTQEQQLIMRLNAKADLFQQSKRILAPDIKPKIIAIIDLYQRGELDLAEQQINTIIATQLNLSSNVYVLAGDISAAQGKNRSQSTTTAREHYQKALAMNRNNAKAANRLAMLMREQGDFEQAASLYTQAINAQATYAPSYRNRAILFDLYMNKKQQALSDYQTYSALLFDYQKQIDEALIVVNNKQQKALKQDQKLAKRWLADIQGQLKILARKAAKKQASANQEEKP